MRTFGILFMQLFRFILGLLIMVAALPCLAQPDSTLMPDSLAQSEPQAELIVVPADPMVGVRFVDSLIKNHPMAQGEEWYAISKERIMHDDTPDFYLLLALFLLLGLIRTQDRRYFQSLARLFFNPIRSPRQLNEKMQSAERSNFLMNIFFAVSVGAYLYYVVRAMSSAGEGVPAFWMILLMAGVAAVYLAKYVVIRVSGWAFRAEAATEQYLFNVFLVNKILAISLLPFIVLLAFGEPEWRNTVLIVSLIIGGGLMLNRYLRSWQIFGSFFQYSRFHFFMYLCASELLPLAVLIKLMLRWMI